MFEVQLDFLEDFGIAAVTIGPRASVTSPSVPYHLKFQPEKLG